MSHKLKKIWAVLESLAAEGREISAALDAFLSNDDAAPSPAEPPNPVVSPGKVLPLPPTPPAQSQYPVLTGLKATEWLTKADDESGETDKQPMYGFAPRNYHGCGLVTVGVSVPDHVLPGDGIKARLSGHPELPWVYGRIIEGGPHYTDDPYLRTGKRPRAETAENNHASLDFTPAFMAKILGRSVQECWEKELSAMVDAQFVPAADMPDDAHLIVPAPHGSVTGAAIVAAARSLPVPFPYAPETRGGNLGCADVVSTALRAAGVPIPIILGVDDVVAALLRLGWRDVDKAGYADGCVIVWAAIPQSNGHKHIGILAHDAAGQLTAINNSSNQLKVIEEVLATKTRPIERVLAMPS